MQQPVEGLERLLDGVRPEIVTGDGFIKIRDAARLSNIHPVALEMGQKLIDTPGKSAASFHLGTREMKEQAAAIQKLLLKGLRRVAVYMGDGKLSVRSARIGDKLSFWFEAKGHSRKPK